MNYKIILIILICIIIFIFFTNNYIKEYFIKKKRVAICMRGAIGKMFEAFTNESTLYSNSEYIDYKSCYNSIIKHIINVNKEFYDIDFFTHCWNIDLEDEIIKLYKPKKFLFENNIKYNNDILNKCINEEDFGGISQALTMKKSIQLKEEYEMENKFKYDIVILYRYDVLLWKDMIFDNYNFNNIYVNAHPDYNGNFHFLMNNKNSYYFKHLYDSINYGNRHFIHFWIKNYIINYMNQNIEMDDIIPGLHQEVLRKINDSINNNYITIEQVNSYKQINHRAI
jgi:hypothetical protein